MKISGPLIGTLVSAVHHLPAVALYTLASPVGNVGSSVLHILGFLKQLTGKRFIEVADVESSCYFLVADIWYRFLQHKDTSRIVRLRQILEIIVIRWRTDT